MGNMEARSLSHQFTVNQENETSRLIFKRISPFHKENFQGRHHFQRFTQYLFFAPTTKQFGFIIFCAASSGLALRRSSRLKIYLPLLSSRMFFVSSYMTYLLWCLAEIKMSQHLSFFCYIIVIILFLKCRDRSTSWGLT